MQSHGTDHALAFLGCADRRRNPDVDRDVAVEYRVIAESAVHRDRRLLVDRIGQGYLQLDRVSDPLPLSDRDFARLRSMEHYQSVQNGKQALLDEIRVQHAAD